MAGEPKIEEGRVLVAALEAAGVRVTAAMWFLATSEQEDQWTLVIASPLVDEFGPLGAYSEVFKDDRVTIEMVNAVDRVTLVPPNDPIVHLLSNAIGVDNGSGIRFTGTLVEGIYIEDAYMYKLSAAA